LGMSGKAVFPPHFIRKRASRPMNSADNSGTNKEKYIKHVKHAVISRRAFFAIGQIYFGIFQTLAGAIALSTDGQYHLVS